MLPARLGCLHGVTSEHVPAGTCSWSILLRHTGQRESLGQGGEQQHGGSSTHHLHMYALSLGQALGDPFTSAEYGELQLVQEAYKGIVNEIHAFRKQYQCQSSAFASHRH